MSVGSNTPYKKGYAGPLGAKPLYHSPTDRALFLGKMFAKGYGPLPAGTIVCQPANRAELMPYPGSDQLAIKTPGRAISLADLASGATTVNMSFADSYKFVVGDSLILCRNNSGSAAYHDGGVITAIDRTSKPGWAIVTFTTATADATFTTANSTSCFVKTATASPFFKAVYILDQAIDTGTGEHAEGGQASVVVSNAILNTSVLTIYDAKAKTDLGTLDDGVYTILK